MLANKMMFSRHQGYSEPIFHSKQVEFDLYYAPGYLAVVDALLEKPPNNRFPTKSNQSKRVRAALLHHARLARQTWQASHISPFTPFCLTLYLHNECNLHCSYCFAAPSPQPAERLTLPVAKSAASVVVSHCHQHNQPFTLVCHGGGEPTLNHKLLVEILEAISQIASSANVPIFRYIATNGVISPSKAHWLADHFDLIGLSCDGPPAIQDGQRPLFGKGHSSRFVKQTADIFCSTSTPFDVRVTVTKKTIGRQPELADYICRELRPREIHVEPVYQGGRTKTSIATTDAALFVESFIEAKRIAASYDINWSMSGSRLESIHGPYCNQFRHVLNVIPGGAATTCFKASKIEQVEQMEVKIGAYQPEGASFQLDTNKIEELAKKLHQIPDLCQNCFNQFHCVRGCPDYCPLDTGQAYHPETNFRCQISRRLAEYALQQAAHTLWQKARQEGGIAGQRLEEIHE